VFQAIIHEGIEVIEGLVVGSFGVHAEIIIDQWLKYFWVFEDIVRGKSGGVRKLFEAAASHKTGIYSIARSLANWKCLPW
jgi:hypothetical protein